MTQVAQVTLHILVANEPSCLCFLFFFFGLRSYTITVQVIKLTPKCAVLLEIAIWPVRSSLDRCSSIGWETVKGESGIEN